MCATCGRHLWCAATALDSHNKVSYPTFQKQPCLSSNYTLFHKYRWKATHLSKHRTHIELHRHISPLHFSLDVSWNSIYVGITLYLVCSRSFHSVGHCFNFCFVFIFIFFLIKFKMNRMNAGHWKWNAFLWFHFTVHHIKTLCPRHSAQDKIMTVDSLYSRASVM